MSMLAERKRKQKWMIHQGNLNKQTDWSKDANKFGQRMLERMGWKEGKGLGRNEDGLTDYVKVAYKANSKGVGFKESVEWSEQQDNFKMLLEELSSSKNKLEEKPQEVKSLEEKSQNSRARLHYRKFTRGKDLNRYSEKDLANIFGKKKLAMEMPKEDTVDVPEEKPSNHHGVVTVAGGCMVKYFKNKKLSKFEKSSDVSSKSLSDIEDDCTSFGFGYNSKAVTEALDLTNADFNTCFDSKNGNSSNETTARKKCKKSKDKRNELKNTFVSYVASENIEETAALQKMKAKISEEPYETPKKRKAHPLETSDEVVDAPSTKKHKADANRTEISKKSKKSKKKAKGEEVLPQLGLTNPAFEPLGRNISIQKHVLDTITENETENDLSESQATVNEESSKVKKKKSKSEGKPDQDSTGDALEINLEQSFAEMQPKRGKNKQKQDDANLFAIDNPSFDINCNLEPSETSQEHEVKRKKKKKSKGVDNPALSDSCSSFADSQLQKENSIHGNGDLEFDSTSQDYEVKRKKKKSKSLDNPALNLNDSPPDLAGLQLQETYNEDSYEVKRKSKKKCNGLDNPALNLNDSSSSPYECQKNQNDNKSLQNGIENTALEISDCDIILNVTSEPVKAAVIPKMDKNTPKNRSKSVRFSRTNQEYIVSDRSPGDIDRRNELYDINTKVIQEGLRDLKKQKRSSPTQDLPDHAFDIKSVDKIDFCDDGSSKFKKHFKAGIDNRAFDAMAQNVEESVNSLTKTIDQYQAEVENGINESKVKRHIREEFMVGELNNSDGENEPHEEGVMFRFKYALFNKREPLWFKRNNAFASLPKKAYKHLIRGDIIVGFKDTNLHKITGYGMTKSGKID